MLSNKLTFSLASLVVIIAIGLVFGVTPAMGQGYIQFQLIAVPDDPNTADVDESRNYFVVIAPNNNDVAASNGGIENNMIDGATVVRVESTPDWVNLQDFFTNGGGTLELIGPEAQMKKEIVISEIMWGSDLDPDTTASPVEALQGSQWIELYVREEITTTETWYIKFTANELTATEIGKPSVVVVGTDGTLVDVMSNWGLGFWNIAEDGAYGQSGNEAEAATSTTPAVDAKRRISMYRDIDYKGAKTAETAAAATGATEAVMKAETAKAIAAMKDGTRSGNWKESAAPRGTHQGGTVFASPGEEHFTGLVEASAPTEIARDGVVFNEIANRAGKTNDWIELYNQKKTAVKVSDWVLSRVDAAPAPEATEAERKAADAELVKFTGDDEIFIPGEGYLLIVNTDPADDDNVLAVGTNVAEEDSEAQGVRTLYYVDADLDLPDEAPFLLILRTEAKPSEADKLVDVAAGNLGYFPLKDDDPPYNTDVWPLKSTQATDADDLGIPANGNTWVRDQAIALFHADAWKSDGGVTGLGIDRDASANNTGTPGYDNGASKGEFMDADGKAVFTGTVKITEIMVAQTKRNLPQWIELYNSSMTQGVNLKNWELKIINYNSPDLDARTQVTLKIKDDLRIGPNQTALIISGSGRKSDSLPQVYDLFRKHKSDLEMTRKTDSVLSVEGFYISLSDGRDNIADDVGNIDDNPKTDDEPAWAIPMSEDGRSSIMRRHDDGTARDGTEEIAWILTESTPAVSVTYYGDSDDIGSPGARGGSALPVSLSSFRPVRDQVTGEVVIRWITQSELNNAGFNILRSETKNGEFKVVNLKGIIAGHGTTSEQHVYEWKDTTAKPNVVYYYQIEDVSLDGKRTRLAQTHLRGNVNAAGKATIRWGELKSQR